MAFHIFGRALLTGRPIEIYGDGTQSREFTYVDDVVDAVVLAAERGEPGAVYNVGGGSETTLLDVVSLMMQLAGREVPVLHRDSMAGDARRTAADLTLARQQLGYAPKVSLPDGLQAELDWLRGLLNRETRAGSAADLLKTGARR
jgi:UDP-glucose 4-epimerase